PCAMKARTSADPESYPEGRNHSRLLTTMPSRIQESFDNSRPPSKPAPIPAQPSGTGPNTESKLLKAVGVEYTNVSRLGALPQIAYVTIVSRGMLPLKTDICHPVGGPVWPSGKSISAIGAALDPHTGAESASCKP